MQKVNRILIFSLLILPFFSFKTFNKEKVNWISIGEMNERYAKEPRPILMDVYTDWCGWCKEMDRTTYKNEKLAKYINEHYYAVKLNAESKENLRFNNKTYGYNAANKSNDLAAYLLFGRMEFPTTVFLATLDANPAPLPGFMKAREMEAPLKYFGEGAHKTESFIEFNHQFKTSW